MTKVEASKIRDPWPMRNWHYGMGAQNFPLILQNDKGSTTGVVVSIDIQVVFIDVLEKHLVAVFVQNAVYQGDDVVLIIGLKWPQLHDLAGFGKMKEMKTEF